MANIPTVQGRSVAPAGGPSVFQNPGDTRGAFGEAAAEAQGKMGEALQKSSAILAQSAMERAAADRRLDARQDAITRGTVLDNLNQQLAKEFLSERTYSGFSSATRADGTLETGEARIQAFRGKVNEIVNQAVQKGNPSFLTDDGFLILQENANQLGAQYHSRAVDEGLKEGVAKFQGRYEKFLSGEASKVLTIPGALDDVEAGVHQYIRREMASGLPPSAAAKLEQEASETLAKAAVGHYLTKNLAVPARQVLDEQTSLGRVSAPVRLDLSLKILAKEVEHTQRIEKTQSIVNVMREFDPNFKPDAAFIAATQGIQLQRPEKPLEAVQKVQIWAAINSVPLKQVPAKIWDRALALEEKAPFGRTPQGRAQELAADFDFTTRMASGQSTTNDRVEFLSAVSAMRTIDPQTQTKTDIPLHWREMLVANDFDPDTGERRSGTGSVFDWIAAGKQADAGGVERPGSQEATQGAALRSLATASEKVRAGLDAAKDPAQAAVDARDKNLQGVGTTFFQSAELLTGFKSTARNALLSMEPVAEVGGLGFSVETFQAARALRTNYDLFLVYMGEAANNTPRFADAFRTSIEKALEPLKGNALFENPDGLRAGLVGLDMNIERHILENRAKLTEKKLEVAERKQTELFVNKLEAMRRTLAAPPRVRTSAELYSAIRTLGLKPGDPIVYMKKDGSMEFQTVKPGMIGR